MGDQRRDREPDPGAERADSLPQAPENPAEQRPHDEAEPKRVRGPAVVDQLAETTMNAENRNLVQIRVEDGIEADDVFTTLMGDIVEPRRRFIEDNALNVVNLDV